MRHTSRRLLPTAAGLALLLTAITGCFTTTADFRADAEAFIVQDADLRDAAFPDSDVAFTTATCSEPANQDEGTTFACTAVDSVGGSWEFEIVITGSAGYDVNVSRRPLGS